jgi:general stress protein CsbA
MAQSVGEAMRTGYSRTEWICLSVIAGVIVAASLLPEKWAIALAFPPMLIATVILARHTFSRPG